MLNSPSVAALVVAAGRGHRAGGGLPKQYRALAGRCLLSRTLEGLAAAKEVDEIVVVIHPDDESLYRAALGELGTEIRAKIAAPAFGAASRQGSVRNGLEALAAQPKPPEIVLIHDAARPFVSSGLIERAVAAANTHGAAVPATLVTDTIQVIDGEGRIVATPDRGRLRAAQTPQSFRFDLILDAHRRAADGEFTDDAAVAAFAGEAVRVFEGETYNMKVTTSADFERAEARLAQAAGETRVAQGYDVHAFAEGDHVWLGGVKIAHDRRLSGHSDADVVLHALTDALLGAIGDGDIGVHFPPSDPQWRGAASRLFLADAAQRVRQRGGTIVHLDVNIVCEAPKIGPHREGMRQTIADIAGIDLDRVGIKATTSEGLGFIGRREGIAALATATIRLPPRQG